MPAESPWPLMIAFAVTIAFALLLTTHYVVAGALFGLAALALAGWHGQEPEAEAA